MEEDQLFSFLKEAKLRGYSSGIIYESTNLHGFREFNFQKGNCTYSDTYVGTLFFMGHEVVTENKIPLWGMVYSGGIVDDNFGSKEVYSFLKDALKRVDEEFPVRGKAFLSNNRYIYQNAHEGDFGQFIGYESIEANEELIYELHYSGGYIE
jgi:predicted small secreted protein